MIVLVKSRCPWQLAVAWVALPLAAHCQEAPGSAPKRPITVSDAVRINRLADDDYFAGDSSDGRVAHFSPNGKQFIVILRKGNLEQNTNEFSLLLFQAADAFQSPKARVLVKMSSSSNRDAIKDLAWLADNRTVTFVGENPGEVPQVYQLDVETKRLVRITNNITPIVNAIISSDGEKMLFAANAAEKSDFDTEEARRRGITITTQRLQDILAGKCREYCLNLSEGADLLFKTKRGAPTLVPLHDVILKDSLISFSPDGRYAVFTAFARDIPDSWKEYQDDVISKIISQNPPSGTASQLRRYMVFDTETGRVEPLLDAPVFEGRASWRPSGQNVLIAETYLPLGVSDPAEREERKKKKYAVEISLPDKRYRKVSEEDRRKETDVGSPVEITLEEDVNTPPKVYAYDAKSKQRALLLDLNPQFQELSFGKVEVVEWNGTDGAKSKGGLYLPPDYIPRKKYPLIIQTHGFSPNRFSMDGRDDWSSAYAARALAARGFLVLQSSMFVPDTSEDRSHEALREMARYEGAIDYLDGGGLIDRTRVGIVGFSRTVYEVGYALTHSKYAFSAAVLVDGVDASYFQYLSFSNSVPGLSRLYEQLNGGSPFGDGLSSWLKNSPGSNMVKMRTPLRLVALGPHSVLEEWEWFSALSLMKKPVDFIYLPDAVHIIVKPWEQIASQQGIVDWFRFWLQGEEDPDPAKVLQYRRWREMRDSQAARGPTPRQ